MEGWVLSGTSGAACNSRSTQYIGWISDDKLAWVLRQEGMAADPRVEIGPRPIPQEPLVCLYVATAVHPTDGPLHCAVLDR